MNHVVIIGDIKKSRELEDRNKVQKKFLETLDTVNAVYKDYILADFIITIGDEFQGLLKNSDKLMDILEYIDMAMSGVMLRYGIGVGHIDSEIKRHESNKIDGPAYHRARAMIQELEVLEQSNQAPKTNVMIDSGESDELINALFAMMSSMKQSWTNRQKEVIISYIKNEKNQYKTARSLSVQQSTINRSLNAANYYTYQYAYESLKKHLESEGI